MNVKSDIVLVKRGIMRIDKTVAKRLDKLVENNIAINQNLSQSFCGNNGDHQASHTSKSTPADQIFRDPA